MSQAIYTLSPFIQTQKQPNVSLNVSLGSSLPGGHAFVTLFPICAVCLSNVV